MDMVGVESRVRQSLNNYRAIRMSLYKNGDPWFGPVKYHFLPGRDVTSLDSLFRGISPKMDLLNGMNILLYSLLDSKNFKHFLDMFQFSVYLDLFYNLTF